LNNAAKARVPGKAGRFCNHIQGEMKMKVLLVNGSPHEEGCTYTALSEIAGALNKNEIETEIFHIGVKPISGCMACGHCFEKGACVVNDGVNEFVAKSNEADGFIFGSPVYFASASGSLTAFMDRVFFSNMRGAFRGKPAAAIVSCRRGGASAAFDRLNKYFSISQMPIVTSQYWNMVHGFTPDDVRKDLEGLQTMRTLGNNMAWLLKCIKAGRAAGIELPVPEERIATNFIR
jgi:multimeric flavodoxin WrbA